MKLGIHDPANAQAKHDGCVKGGNALRDKKIGMIGAKIDVWWSRLNDLREYIQTVSVFYFTLH